MAGEKQDRGNTLAFMGLNMEVAHGKSTYSPLTELIIWPHSSGERDWESFKEN